MRTWPARIALGSVAVATAAGIGPAAADPLPYGPDTCLSGFVWREAESGDTVCVTPDIRDRTRNENANPADHKQPGGGAYGPQTCAAGFVWREAFSGDTICVTPDERSQTKADNAAAASRKASTQSQQGPANHAGSVILELTGSGTALTIDMYDPAAQPRKYDVPLPFSHTGAAAPKSGDLLEIVGVGKGSAAIGCRIKVDGAVVAEHAVGTGGQCVYNAP